MSDIPTGVSRDSETLVTLAPRPSREKTSVDHGNGGKRSSGGPGAESPESQSHAAAPTDPARWVADLLVAAGAARIGRKWQCPAHGTTGEHDVSLTLGTGRDGRLLLYCHAGCGWPDILRALMLDMSTLWTAPPTQPARHARLYLRRLRFPPPRSAGTLAEQGYRFEAEHPYGDDPRSPVAWKVRLRQPSTGRKAITWESRNPGGERVPGLFGLRQAELPLYREHDLRMATAADEPVLVVESESSVDALVRAGQYAVTWPGGASDPPVARIRELLGDYRRAVLVPDNDDAGRACAEKLVRGDAVHRLLAPGPGEDARDLLDRVGPARFRELVAGALARTDPDHDGYDREETP